MKQVTEARLRDLGYGVLSDVSPNGKVEENLAISGWEKSPNEGPSGWKRTRRFRRARSALITGRGDLRQDDALDRLDRPRDAGGVVGRAGTGALHRRGRGRSRYGQGDAQGRRGRRVMVTFDKPRR